MIIYFAVFAILIVGRAITTWKFFKYTTAMYYITSILVGGGHVAIPMMFTAFEKEGFITAD